MSRNTRAVNPPPLPKDTVAQHERVERYRRQFAERAPRIVQMRYGRDVTVLTDPTGVSIVRGGTVLLGAGHTFKVALDRADARLGKRPMGVVEAERAREQAGGRSLQPVPTTPEPVSPATPRRSYASMALANRVHGADGKFISRAFQREVAQVRDLLRGVRDGGAE